MNSLEAWQLDLPPYLSELVAYLRTEEAELWAWFEQHRDRQDYAESSRLELLKSTYRLSRETDSGIYEIATDVAQRLNIGAPITVYQAQGACPLNAGLARIPNEVHVILYGPVAERLDRQELRALFSHELSHYTMWHIENGDYRVAEEVLAALCNQQYAHPAHGHSLRLFGLYTEITCDRGALQVSGDAEPVIATLLKTTTGLENVNAASYLQQAEEIFRQEDASTTGLTHPEAYIRARAAKLWFDRDAGAEAKIKRMIEGRLVLDELDLLSQRQVSEQTRHVIDALLRPVAMQTDAMLAQARAYFASYRVPSAAPRQSVSSITTEHTSLQDYFAYVLLDFATADGELEELPLAATIRLSQQLGVEERFSELAQREMRLRKRQWREIVANVAKILDE